MTNEGGSCEVFSEVVGVHVVRRAVEHDNGAVLDAFTKRHDAEVDVASASLNRVLAEEATSAVVFVEGGRGRLRGVSIKKKSTNPDDLVGGFASRYELSVGGRGSDAFLLLGFPRDSATVEHQKIARVGAPGIDTCCPIGIGIG
jgi:hypothetical protein